MNAYEQLVSIIKKNTNDKSCFNEDGCGTKENICCHAYCDKLKWIKTRAEEYAAYLNVSWLDVIAGWESKRTYWFMNYYQEYNQPKLDGERVRVFEDLKSFCAQTPSKKFRCPNCGGISTNPYECNSQLKVNKDICDWKSYGLFGTLNKGVYVYIKELLQGNEIFMPIDWENQNK